MSQLIHLDKIPLLPMPISLTEKAAEMIAKALAEEELDDYALRVGVIGGGCSGLQYSLDFSKKSNSLDFIGEYFGVTVLIDPFSAAHLNGTIIDYVNMISDVGFKFENPNIVRSCGCGSSFQT